VHAPQYRGRIDQAVQAVPTASEATHPAIGRGDGEWQEQQERTEPHGDVGSLDDVRADRPQVEPLVEHQPVEEVQGKVGEGVQAEHAPQSHEPGLAQRDGQWRHAQRREQQPQAPPAETVHDLVDGIRPETRAGDAEGAREQPRERQRAGEEEEGLGEATHLGKGVMIRG